MNNKADEVSRAGVGYSCAVLSVIESLGLECWLGVELGSIEVGDSWVGAVLS